MVRTITAIIATMLIAGCAGGSLKPTVPESKDARQACPTEIGTIIDIVEVTLEGPTEAAQGTGAAFGAYLGNRAAKDESDVVEALAMGVGALAGSAAGDLASKSVLSRDGMELMVYVEGTTHSILQESDANQPFEIGQDVWVVGNLEPNTRNRCSTGIRVLIKR